MTNCPTCGHAVIPNENIVIHGDSRIGFTAWVKSSEPIRLTDWEARILGCILPGPIETPALQERAYVGMSMPEHPRKSVEAAISKLRRKLEKHGWTIDHEGKQGRNKGYMGIFTMRRFRHEKW